MNSGFIQAVIEIVFKGNILFLSPFLFLLMVVTFGEDLISLIHTAFKGNSVGGRRGRY